MEKKCNTLSSLALLHDESLKAFSKVRSVFKNVVRVWPQENPRVLASWVALSLSFSEIRNGKIEK